jgi:hypothetical protein
VSKYRRIETTFKDEDTLARALQDVCADLSIAFEHHKEGSHLVGYQGDQRKETAQYIIRRKFIDSCANDLGFHRNESGAFEAVISEYDSTNNGQVILNKIRQRYARLQVEKLARLRGLRVEEVKSNDGTIRLRLMGRQTSSRRAQMNIRRR